jgi:hypothetical protein
VEYTKNANHSCGCDITKVNLTKSFTLRHQQKSGHQHEYMKFYSENHRKEDQKTGVIKSVKFILYETSTLRMVCITPQ